MSSAAIPKGPPPPYSEETQTDIKTHQPLQTNQDSNKSSNQTENKKSCPWSILKRKRTLMAMGGVYWWPMGGCCCHKKRNSRKNSSSG
ncbi:uncharacterized protein SPAPADRAFT_63711 [Spathaspora passalidarum NRRL Y-27907]|uniref:Uncharacterized protein n=1 Tax=Spathaspora passalidarum (strain NRRL Y-27907 / 11-Y1) TaxID=619300 RepID=G3AV13_SPAPN|nr:uncharacterized protein SPAPADRAFT_63711 [Spathaspora passalidarum NRRL Y-27907]EGW30087.1 hypothetical protein SPAPADRAFT_63711 [Spathaspora passalidarum NRRL Y-27907]